VLAAAAAVAQLAAQAPADADGVDLDRGRAGLGDGADDERRQVFGPVAVGRPFAAGDHAAALADDGEVAAAADVDAELDREQLVGVRGTSRSRRHVWTSV
jgi:hypothetical protein